MSLYFTFTPRKSHANPLPSRLEVRTVSIYPSTLPPPQPHSAPCLLTAAGRLRARHSPASGLQHQADDADARGNEPVYYKNKVVGVVTSGGYGFRTKKSLAFAYVKADLAEGTGFEIEIQGKRRKAKILDKVVYDPENKKLIA